MIRSLSKKSKNLAAGLAVLLLLCTAFLSAHNHGVSSGQKDHSCSICQISHSNTRSIVGQTSPQFAELKPVLHLQIPDHFSSSFEKVFSAFIRGPPFSA